MREEVYEFFKEYGFNRDEIHYFQDENEKIFFTNLVEVNKNIDFLINKGLNKEEIMNVFRKDPYMITVKNNRLEALDKIYLEDLRFDINLLKKLIIDNPDTYIASPIELNKIINYLKEHNYNIETIKNFIINNPKVSSMNFIEFEKEIKFN